MTMMDEHPHSGGASEVVTFLGQPVEIAGAFPQPGRQAPPFSLTGDNLQPVTLESLGRARKLLNIYVSIDTPVCEASVRRFDQLAAGLENTLVLGISADLPFALQRFCTSQGIENMRMLSAFRSPRFATEYGVAIVGGPLAGLTTRAVVVLDEDNRVLYSQQLGEITQPPDYEKAQEVLRSSAA
jgi:thioredoxin-dependent peroxiredoxin